MVVKLSISARLGLKDQKTRERSTLSSLSSGAAPLIGYNLASALQRKTGKLTAVWSCPRLNRPYHINKGDKLTVMQFTPCQKDLKSYLTEVTELETSLYDC